MSECVPCRLFCMCSSSSSTATPKISTDEAVLHSIHSIVFKAKAIGLLCTCTCKRSVTQQILVRYNTDKRRLSLCIASPHVIHMTIRFEFFFLAFRLFLPPQLYDSCSFHRLYIIFASQRAGPTLIRMQHMAARVRHCSSETLTLYTVIVILLY